MTLDKVNNKLNNIATLCNRTNFNCLFSLQKIGNNCNTLKEDIIKYGSMKYKWVKAVDVSVIDNWKDKLFNTIKQNWSKSEGKVLISNEDIKDFIDILNQYISGYKSVKCYELKSDVSYFGDCYSNDFAFQLDCENYILRFSMND